jgi:hypothetical protein
MDYQMKILQFASKDYDLKTRKALAMLGVTCKVMHGMAQDTWKHIWNRYKAANPSCPNSPAITVVLV